MPMIPQLRGCPMPVKGFVDATEISPGGTIPSGNLPLHLEASNTLSFSLPQELIHGHSGSVDHKQKPLPWRKGRILPSLNTGKGGTQWLLKGCENPHSICLINASGCAGCHCPKGISTSDGPVPSAQNAAGSDCPRMFVLPGLTLQKHWTAQGIGVLMHSWRIKCQDLINTH